MAEKEPDRASWIQGPSAQCNPQPGKVANPWRLVLLGPPGVGKGTQAELLHHRLHACHLSTGDVFRAAGSKNECDLSPAMKAALEYMRRGDLVPDSIVWEMVLERSGCFRCGGGFLLDGFPRTIHQAESLKRLMENQNIPLEAVVNYELPTSEIVQRLSGRRTCKKCKAVFHVTQRPPKIAHLCDHCEGALFHREDDRTESVKVRLAAYEEKTSPLIQFYREMGLLLPISAVGTPEEICTRTVAALEARKAKTSIAGVPHS
ncbi:MAG TPA: nucleoside monophosphate kinase [Terriglobales bacterium]|nr:nucleoside monophosphate kinase [Terriglobales bacterium]